LPRRHFADAISDFFADAFDYDAHYIIDGQKSQLSPRHAALIFRPPLRHAISPFFHYAIIASPLMPPFRCQLPPLFHIFAIDA